MSVKRLALLTTSVKIHFKAESPKKLIEDILEGRSMSYTYEIEVITDDTLIFNFTYDDWDFKIPVICQLIADKYWIVTK